MSFSELIDQTLNYLVEMPYVHNDVQMPKKSKQREFLEEIQKLLQENKSLLNRFENEFDLEDVDFSQFSYEFNLQFIENIFNKTLDHLKSDLEDDQETLDKVKICIMLELLLLVTDLLLFIVFPHHEVFVLTFAVVFLTSFIITALAGISLQSSVVDKSNLLDSLETNSFTLSF